MHPGTVTARRSRPGSPAGVDRRPGRRGYGDRVSTAWRAQEWADPAVAERVCGPGIDPALDLARDLEPVARHVADDPWRYLSVLATLGAADLTAARAAEPHLDAVAILAQAGDPDLSSLGGGEARTFGVYAAQAPGAGLRLDRGGDASPGGDDATSLSGTKAWCSLGDRLSHALVTVDAAEGKPLLHAVSLHHPGVSIEPGAWVSRGLAAIRTVTLRMEQVPSVAVGPSGWYLQRPGFAWGGIGVAAVWFGGAAAVGGQLQVAAARREPDQIALLHLGRVDQCVHTALTTLRDAAECIRTGRANGAAGALLAARVRAVVAHSAEEILDVVGHALGPAPLTHDETHARRVADLTVYLRQHHAERDLAALGSRCAPPPDPDPGAAP